MKTTVKTHSRIEKLLAQQEEFLGRPNQCLEQGHGWFEKYRYPIVTADHIPLAWRYDLNPETNPYGLERIGVNAAFNAGALYWKGRFLLCVRIEGKDRKSYFGIAESPNGIDNFRFWDRPISLPQTEEPDTNAYDMRLIAHEDGYVYGIFCAERKDGEAPAGDTSSAVASAGIVRTKDLIHWERLPDLVTKAHQQRNVVLHPEFVNDRYALYTRPQDGFIETGSGGGIGLGYVQNMEHPVVEDETILHQKKYHTVYELKNGQGPAPLKTKIGWLHLAHGVRNTAAGLRYVLYMFVTALDDISKVIYEPAGYFMAPDEQEIIGDVGNVLFCNGWILKDDGQLFIYYASSDTRMHVATTDLNRVLDYCVNTPQDGFTSASSVQSVLQLIDANQPWIE